MATVARGMRAAGVVLLLGALLTGCGQEPRPRWFEYENVQDGVRGKINLDNITRVTPRVRFGTEEMRLHADSVERILTALGRDEYTSFRVRAWLLFDREEVVLYESELFEKDRNPVTRRDRARIGAELKKALRTYERI